MVKGPVNPTQHGNMTFSVLEGAQQYCLCFQHTACRQLTEQGAYLNLQVAGFRVDILYWCWAFPQIAIQTVNECYNVFFSRRRMAVKCHQGVSSLGAPLPALSSTFACSSREENTFG